MHLIPVVLKTHNQTLLKIMKIPLLGPLIIIIFGAMPFLILDIIGQGVAIPEQTVTLLGGIATVGWNFYLKKIGTEIKLIFIPMWVWGIIFLILGLLGKTM